jgi:hypothetical protein
LPEFLLAEIAEFRRNAIQARYFSDYLATAVPRTAIEAYYRDNGQEYESERVRVAHILVRAKRAATDKERAEKRAKVEAAYQDLKKGKPFAEVAKAFSDDQVSGANGGEMGWISKGAINPRFSEVAFGLKAGEFSEPFETAFGYQIVKVLEGPEVSKKPLASVESQIRQKLRAQAKLAEEIRLRELVPSKVSRGDWKPESFKTLPPLPAGAAGVNPSGQGAAIVPPPPLAGAAAEAAQQAQPEPNQVELDQGDQNQGDQNQAVGEEH